MKKKTINSMLLIGVILVSGTACGSDPSSVYTPTTSVLCRERTSNRILAAETVVYETHFSHDKMTIPASFENDYGGVIWAWGGYDSGDITVDGREFTVTNLSGQTDTEDKRGAEDDKGVLRFNGGKTEPSTLISKTKFVGSVSKIEFSAKNFGKDAASLDLSVSSDLTSYTGNQAFELTADYVTYTYTVGKSDVGIRVEGLAGRGNLDWLKVYSSSGTPNPPSSGGEQGGDDPATSINEEDLPWCDELSTSSVDDTSESLSTSEQTSSSNPTSSYTPPSYNGNGILAVDTNQQLNNYYKSAYGKTGNELVNAIQDIIHNVNRGSYSSASDKLPNTDRDADNPNMVRGIYDGKLYSPVKANASGALNKEHVWPDSKFPDGYEGDLHNLRASEIKVNGSRGNTNFGEGSGEWDPDRCTSSYPTCSTKKYSDRGDVARMVLYMVTMYNHPLCSSYSCPNTPSGVQAVIKLETVIKWHNEDPVDQFEINRNSKIFGYQNNRNPFIDHPELVSILY